MIKIKNVLIVDDCAEIQMLLSTLLTAKGYQVDCVSNGKEALDHLEQKKETPGAILVDMRMPVMGGLDFLESIKNLKNLDKIPIVLMSGDDDLNEKGSRTQARELVQKPLNSSQILQLLDRIFIN